MVLTPWAMREATVASAVVIASMRATWLRWCSGQLHRSWLCCRGRVGCLHSVSGRLIPAAPDLLRTQSVKHLGPHPEEPCAARRLEGWMHGMSLLPSFETAAARPPQDEVRE